MMQLTSKEIESILGVQDRCNWAGMRIQADGIYLNASSEDLHGLLNEELDALTHGLRERATTEPLLALPCELPAFQAFLRLVWGRGLDEWEYRKLYRLDERFAYSDTMPDSQMLPLSFWARILGDRVAQSNGHVLDSDAAARDLEEVVRQLDADHPGLPFRDPATGDLLHDGTERPAAGMLRKGDFIQWLKAFRPKLAGYLALRSVEKAQQSVGEATGADGGANDAHSLPWTLSPVVAPDGADGQSRAPDLTWEAHAEVRIPGGPRLISKQKVLDGLLDATMGALPEETMDGPIRKARCNAPHFLKDYVESSWEELTSADEVHLEIAWMRAGLVPPEHPTRVEWDNQYLRAWANLPDRPDWTPVSSWGLNRRIAERSRKLIGARYEREVFAALPSFDGLGLQAPAEVSLYWNVDDVKSAIGRLGMMAPAATITPQAPQEQLRSADGTSAPEARRGATPSTAEGLPRGLTKREIGSVFNSVAGKDVGDWIKTLENAREGLKRAITEKRRPGDKDGGNLWNPVTVARYTIGQCKDADQRSAVMKAFAKAFIDRELLKPWLGAWQSERRDIIGNPWGIPGN